MLLGLGLPCFDLTHENYEPWLHTNITGNFIFDNIIDYNL